MKSFLNTCKQLCAKKKEEKKGRKICSCCCLTCNACGTLTSSGSRGSGGKNASSLSPSTLSGTGLIVYRRDGNGNGNGSGCGDGVPRGIQLRNAAKAMAKQNFASFVMITFGIAFLKRYVVHEPTNIKQPSPPLLSLLYFFWPPTRFTLDFIFF